MDQHERQLAQAAEQLAGAVYAFLQACNSAAASLNLSLQAAQAGGWPLLLVKKCCDRRTGPSGARPAVGLGVCMLLPAAWPPLPSPTPRRHCLAS